jgi:hypothetical protein
MAGLHPKSVETDERPARGAKRESKSEQRQNPRHDPHELLSTDRIGRSPNRSPVR